MNLPFPYYEGKVLLTSMCSFSFRKGRLPCEGKSQRIVSLIPGSFLPPFEKKASWRGRGRLFPSQAKEGRFLSFFFFTDFVQPFRELWSEFFFEKSVEMFFFM